MNITKEELIQTFSKDRVENYIDEYEYIENLKLIKKNNLSFNALKCIYATKSMRR